jgi:hypothetical protein
VDGPAGLARELLGPRLAYVPDVGVPRARHIDGTPLRAMESSKADRAELHAALGSERSPLQPSRAGDREHVELSQRSNVGT